VDAQPLKKAARAVVVVVLLTDLVSATGKAYICIADIPPPEGVDCRPAGEILPDLAFKIAALIHAASGGAPAGGGHGVPPH